MGAWGSGPFDNDDAGDFVADLIDAGDWGPVEAAFDAVLAAGEDYLGASESSTAIAAAAIVAHKVGNGLVSIHPEDAAGVTALNSPPPQLVAKARAALARIRKQSELADLWEEVNAKDEWLATLESIEKAL